MSLYLIFMIFTHLVKKIYFYWIALVSSEVILFRMCCFFVLICHILEYPFVEEFCHTRSRIMFTLRVTFWKKKLCLWDTQICWVPWSKPHFCWDSSYNLSSVSSLFVHLCFIIRWPQYVLLMNLNIFRRGVLIIILRFIFLF